MLTREDILRGLRSIDERAGAAGMLVDMSIYGGAALMLAFDLRLATRDVDAVVRGSSDFVRTVAREIAEDEGWPEGWLNDAVKGFTSAFEQMTLMERFQATAGGGLRVHLPTPGYLFAMKCMAMRPEGIEGSRDISDIEALADLADVQDVAGALALVEAFYPAAQIPPKVRFGIEEIMERVEARRRSAEPPPSV